MGDSTRSERISLRLHSPEAPGFRAASWRTQYQLLKALDAGWAKAWLSATRTALTAAGADRTSACCHPARRGPGAPGVGVGERMVGIFGMPQCRHRSLAVKTYAD
ncbi:hypothetical protein CJ179_36480 [Rhodococcus sp. ACS1]|nr:hypothetical protein CJ179_36480 [Rhodococcus sp. ACS1]